ncbi:MAG: T9SS type A sorting domain-containing protein [Bacteroidales bacterium]|nr:T9SS type A sorting domain-containing protein [Bacteroidales bacterium]
MRNFLLSGVFILSVFISNAQIINVNPDKNGEPWIVGGLRVPSQEEINKIPVLTFPEEYNTKDLPSSLDNSTTQYFRPIFSQTHGSCAQASGTAYLFTYEINRIRETSANISSNQFPSHYTYNFLNGGSGANGSWMQDGWEIIKASGCPTVATYGGLTNSESDKYWMSGYDDYISGTDNRVSEIFSINVGTPEGLETLKYWMYDHLDGADIGSIVNFAAGISNDNYQTSGDKIISWGNPINHAMTFVGWDDNIEYDYSNDGNITNDVDINSDGVVDMKDWERGALIMVNSWGTSWMGDGKAYVMYKLLAESVENGGIHANKVYGINVKETQTPQLLLKVKAEHNSRNKIKVSAGISEDITDTSPEYVLNFPMFNKQGGDYDMRGTSSLPIEFTTDITPLLNHITSGENAVFFLQVTEDDPYSSGTGMIYDFSIVDNEGNEYICSSHNVSIVNNDLTQLSVIAQIEFEAPEITTQSIPEAAVSEYFSFQLEAEGGSEPYNWNVIISYNEETINESYPSISSNQLTPNDNDDGYVVQSIDFDFPFYGELYNEFTVSTDGSLLFEEGFEYLRTEEAIMGTKIIGVFASDLMIFPEDNDGLFYEGDENSATFRWKTSLYGDQSADIDAAVTLFPNGDMKFYYGDNITEGLSWASGISNGSGSYKIADISGSYSPSNSQHKFSSGAYPFGMEITSSGLFEGIAPDETSSWDIEFIVTDNNNISKTKTLTFYTILGSVNEHELENIRLFPNPFSESVLISYFIENESYVNLSIYDIAGRHIQTLINENQTAGDYQTAWSPNVPHGLYVYRIETDGFTQTGKLIFQ